MVTVSLREFQHNAKKLLENLPITLTIYGRPVAIVDTYRKSVDTSGEIPKKTSTMPENIESPNFRFCELFKAHGFIKGAKYECKMITYEDANGNPIIDRKWGCSECISHLEGLGVGRVYFI